MTRRYTRENLIAPYYKYAPSPLFWTSLFARGTYLMQVQGCNWRCAACWSASGHRAQGPRYEFTPEQVVDKMVNGMVRNAMTAARISGGEPALYWDHTEAVIHDFVERTRDLRIHVPGETGRRGDPASIIIETTGTLGVTPTSLQRLEDRLGKDAERVIIHLGIKATSPAQLAELTGMTLQTCERFHAQQLENLLHAATELKHLVVHASFLDRFTDPSIYAAILREVERGRPGMSRNIGILDFKPYANGNPRLKVPAAIREDTRDDPGADDDELVNALATREGGRRHAIERDETDLTPELEVRDPAGVLDAVELGEAFEAAVDGRLT